MYLTDGDSVARLIETVLRVSSSLVVIAVGDTSITLWGLASEAMGLVHDSVARPSAQMHICH